MAGPVGGVGASGDFNLLEVSASLSANGFDIQPYLIMII